MCDERGALWISKHMVKMGSKHTHIVCVNSMPRFDHRSAARTCRTKPERRSVSYTLRERERELDLNTHKASSRDRKRDREKENVKPTNALPLKLVFVLVNSVFLFFRFFHQCLLFSGLASTFVYFLFINDYTMNWLPYVLFFLVGDSSIHNHITPCQPIIRTNDNIAFRLRH